MKLNKWCFSVLAASLAALGLADNHLVFRHNGYGQRDGMGNDNWINMKLSEYRGGGELGSDLNKYIGTGKYMLGRSQNLINTWFLRTDYVLLTVCLQKYCLSANR